MEKDNGKKIFIIVLGFSFITFSGILLSVTRKDEVDYDFKLTEVFLDEEEGKAKSSDEMISSIPTLTNFNELLNEIDFFETNFSTQKITIFIPNDEAFQAYGIKEKKLKTYEIRKLIMNHIVAGTHSIDSLRNADSLTSLNGQKVEITSDDNSIRVNGNTLGSAKIFGNITFYEINKVIEPFPGTTINDILLNPENGLVENIEQIDELASFETMLVSNTEVLLPDDTKQYTVFALSNNSIEKLESDGTDDEKVPASDFIVEGIYFSDNLSEAQILKSISGKNLKISISNGVMSINNTFEVKVVDIECSNGVIHIIE